jgi:hypothetical protein
MVKTLNFLIILVFISFNSRASDFNPLLEDDSDLKEPVDQAYVKIKDNLIHSHFPNLIPFSVAIQHSDSLEFLLRSGFSTSDVLRHPLHRKYKIIISRAYAQKMPDLSAIEAAIAHELYHIDDYGRMSGAELFKFVVSYGANMNQFVSCYEHETDYRALLLGYQEGMLNYRNWQQKTMPAKYALKKRKNYFTPEELTSGDWHQYHSCPL